METESQKVERLLAEEFPRQIQSAAIEHLWKAYGEAWATAREFDRAQMIKSYGHLRLALQEQSFKLLAAKFPKFLSAEDYREPGGNYDYLTLRTKSLLITSKAVKVWDDLPPGSTFRNTIAGGVQFHAFENVICEDGRKFYHVLLLHGPQRKLEYNEKKKHWTVKVVRSRPGFMTLAVPEREGAECILRTKLFDEFPETITNLMGLKTEGVADKAQPKAKPKKDRRDDEAASGA
jgi:hypothetical protein